MSTHHYTPAQLVQRLASGMLAALGPKVFIGEHRGHP